MITDFADRHPALSAWIIAALFTVVPSFFVLFLYLLSGGKANTALICLFYALAVQLVLWLKVRRPILVALPFLIMLVGFVVSEIVYTVAMSMHAPGARIDGFAYYFSSAIVSLFGAEAVGVIVAPFIFGLICLVKKIWEHIVY